MRLSTTTRLFTTILILLVACPAAAIVPGWADIDSSALVQPITTTIRYADGEQQRNRGMGFVIGEKFYTAYHNIQSAPAKVVGYEITIDGVAVEPMLIDIAHDLAVFQISGELCEVWCNDLRLGSAAPESATAVMWIRVEEGKHTWQHGRVSNIAFKSVLARGAMGDCRDNLIVEIDKPFVPGSSGGPVFDSASGAVIGLIQGSFETRLGKLTGYYKPVECVLTRLGKAG